MGHNFYGDLKYLLLEAGFLTTTILCVTSCSSSGPRNHLHAPMPPPTVMTDSGEIIVPPSAQGSGVAGASLGLAQNNIPGKSCSFSSFHRKNTFGYEIDPSQHISFTASPSFDIWDPGDFEAKFNIKFTRALGGPANKRPCTFGTGYYGLLPYLLNNEGTLDKLTDTSSIKSMVQERINEREAERKKRMEMDKGI